jgi:hypothetical protein
VQNGGAGGGCGGAHGAPARGGPAAAAQVAACLALTAVPAWGSEHRQVCVGINLSVLCVRFWACSRAMCRRVGYVVEGGRSLSADDPRPCALTQGCCVAGLSGRDCWQCCGALSCRVGPGKTGGPWGEGACWVQPARRHAWSHSLLAYQACLSAAAVAAAWQASQGRPREDSLGSHMMCNLLRYNGATQETVVITQSASLATSRRYAAAGWGACARSQRLCTMAQVGECARGGAGARAVCGQLRVPRRAPFASRCALRWCLARRSLWRARGGRAVALGACEAQGPGVRVRRCVLGSGSVSVQTCQCQKKAVTGLYWESWCMGYVFCFVFQHVHGCKPHGQGV